MKKMKKTKMILNVGDWSGDGHGKNTELIYNVNHTVKEVQEAYKKSCNDTKVSFNHNDYTNSDRSYTESQKYLICTEYQDVILNQTVYDILVNFIPQETLMSFIEDYDNEFYIEDFEGLWWEFVKISLPDLTYDEQLQDIPEINGYGNLNAQFGYGLFE